MPGKVALAYSGGLDTSVAIRWLKEKYNLDVIAVTEEHLMGGVAEMGRKDGSSLNGGINIIRVRSAVADAYHQPSLKCPLDEIQGTGAFRRKGNDANKSL